MLAGFKFSFWRDDGGRQLDGETEVPVSAAHRNGADPGQATFLPSADSVMRPTEVNRRPTFALPTGDGLSVQRSRTA